MDHNAFVEAHEWSLRDGTYVGPSEARARVMAAVRRDVRTKWGIARDVRLRLTSEVLADEAWCRSRRGCCIEAVGRDAADEVWRRAVAAGLTL